MWLIKNYKSAIENKPLVTKWERKGGKGKIRYEIKDTTYYKQSIQATRIYYIAWGIMLSIL